MGQIITTALKLIPMIYALNFLKYAKTHETIDINEWLTSINTKGNRIFLTCLIWIFIIAGVFLGTLFGSAELFISRL